MGSLAWQDVGTGQLAGSGQRQKFSTFWVDHVQRAARAEMALSIRKAAVDADREALMRWHLQQVIFCEIPSRLTLNSDCMHGSYHNRVMKEVVNKRAWICAGSFQDSQIA